MVIFMKDLEAIWICDNIAFLNSILFYKYFDYKFGYNYELQNPPLRPQL